MDSSETPILRLEKRLEALIQKQEDFNTEISRIKQEIEQIKGSDLFKNIHNEKAENKIDTYSINESFSKKSTSDNIVEEAHLEQQINESDQLSTKTPEPKIKRNLEKFIGENLMNKVGIAITIIGIAIGTKYSIEHNLISPLTRIILGYLCGITLLVFGIRLRSKYENYSAVLVSGAMASNYFITFSAYSFFDLIPQGVAFALMVIFTIFTVLAALSYNRQVIAHIGLVGAYAIPFLLSNDSGNIQVLFSYMAIINAGILFISFYKYWKKLFYASFILTWLIYISWSISSYTTERHFGIALSFSTIFYLLFYTTFLAYKLIKNEVFNKTDIILLLTNSFIYYIISYIFIDSNIKYEELLGLFTLCNAIIHFSIGYVVYKQKLADKNLFYVIIGLVLVFITIAIPVQLDGNWVTLLWAGQAAVLFYIGKSKNIQFYEMISYPIVVLAVISIAQDWFLNYVPAYDEINQHIIPILNINFLSSVIFIVALSLMQFINHKYQQINSSYIKITKFFSYFIPTVLIFTIYYAFRMEIAQYWNQAIADSSISIQPEGEKYSRYIQNDNLSYFKTVWLYNYTFVFLSVLSFLNIFKIKQKNLALYTLIISGAVIFLFLTEGLVALGELRDSYVEQTSAQYFNRNFFCITIRYISILLLALLVFSSTKSQKNYPLKKEYKLYFELIIYGIILTILSNELITWLSIYNAEVAYKTSLSILWGAYSLVIIILGIIQKKQHIRFASMGIFGVTLIKLFFYDLTNLNTIQKTIVFVSLGVILLIISFLYNKYKNLINE